MEVFSVLSPDQKLIEKLIEVFFNDKDLCFICEDEDTIYLDGADSARFYLHHDTSFEEEVKINFEQKEEELIRSFFTNNPVFMMDISYNDSAFLHKVLLSFTEEIKLNYNGNKIPLLFHDPFVGFVVTDGIGAVLSQ